MLVEGLITTVIPVYNRPQLVREAVGSVLRQTYRPIEIVIVDDGSTDSTPAVIEEMRASSPSEIRTLAIVNGGPGRAREAGRLLARGEFVQYLDSDDVLLPRKFEVQVDALRKHPSSDVAYGHTYYVEDASAPYGRPWKRTGEHIHSMFPSFLESRWWGTSTPLYRRHILDAVGPWTELINEEDWEYDCRVASMGVELEFCNEPVSLERAHFDARLSQNGTKDVKKLQSRARAHALILEHARRGNVDSNCREMQHFVRELFLLARQCGAAGLEVESRHLFNLSREASVPIRAKGLDFRIYRTAAQLLGWPMVGRLACWMDEWRR